MSAKVTGSLLFIILNFTISPTYLGACDSLNELLSEIKKTRFESKFKLDSLSTEIYKSKSFIDCNEFDLKGNLMYAIGLKYYNLHTKESYAAAEFPFRKALSYRLDSLKMNLYDDEVVKCKINLGRCLDKSSQFGKSRTILESAYAVKDQLDNKKTVGRLLFHLGEVYQKMGIYDRAVHCYEEVITIAESGVSSLLPYQVLSYNNLGISFSENGEHQSSLNSFYIYGNEFLSKDEPDYIRFLLNYAYGLYELALYDSSTVILNQLEQSLVNNYNNKEVDSDWYVFYLENCYLAQVRSYIKLNSIHQAKRKVMLASSLLESKTISYNDNLADIYLAEEKLDSAQFYYHKAIWNGFDNTETMTSFNILPDLNINQPKQYELRDLLEVVSSYAATSFKKFKENKDQNHLILAQSAYELYDQLFVLNFEKLLTDNSRYRLIEEARPAFENAMEVTFELYNSYDKENEEIAEQLFHFSERIRANLLFTSISQKDALNQDLIPDDAKTEIENLQVQIRNLDELLVNSINVQKEDSIRKLIEDLNIQSDIAKASLAKQYPAYHDLAFNNHQLPTFKELRKKLLHNNTTLIEYFTTDEYIYILGVNKRKFFLDRINVTSAIQENLQTFLKSISDWSYISKEKKNAITTYFEKAKYIYDVLLNDALKTFNKQDGDLIIIPDGKLNYIPFSTLLDAPTTSLLNAPFLVQKFNISYDYSAKSLLRNIATNKSESVEEICIFAPTYENIDEWTDLKYNVMEIDLIKSIFNSIKSWKGDQASKTNFEATCNSCGILHIASHGSLDEQDALKNHLVFYAEKDKLKQAELTVGRINLFNLSSNLTVLSSCNTAMGTQKSNEGLTSVSNAFSYAGSKSVMASLWLLNDKQAYNMMDQFYQQLKEGSSKSVALATAQRSIASSRSLHNHPYYWGNLILSGSTDALFKSKSNHKFQYLIAGGVLILLLGGFLLYRKIN